MSQLATTPAPPYYAVIFTSNRTDNPDGYEEMAAAMLELARQQPGYLGVESARQDIGLTVSYWSSLEAIKAWKSVADHRQAQRLGRDRWYAAYQVRIARVERAYGFAESTGATA